MGDDGNRWDADDYDANHDFVYEYGGDVVALLDPQPGERILDLGCGTGHLTSEIADAVGENGTVVGIGQSPEMITQAREAYPDLPFRAVDARTFSPETRFDAVFSNAALHWIPDQRDVLENVAHLLRPGGRFVAEMGGAGNVRAITDAVSAACSDYGVTVEHPWHFPSVAEQATLLEAAGFEVTFARLFDRPTELDDGVDGLANWLAMFGDSLFADLDNDDQRAVIGTVEDNLRPELFDEKTGTWTADYRRLRFVASVPEE